MRGHGSWGAQQGALHEWLVLQKKEVVLFSRFSLSACKIIDL